MKKAIIHFLLSHCFFLLIQKVTEEAFPQPLKEQQPPPPVLVVEQNILDLGEITLESGVAIIEARFLVTNTSDQAVDFNFLIKNPSRDPDAKYNKSPLEAGESREIMMREPYRRTGQYRSYSYFFHPSQTGPILYLSMRAQIVDPKQSIESCE